MPRCSYLLPKKKLREVGGVFDSSAAYVQLLNPGRGKCLSISDPFACVPCWHMFLHWGCAKSFLFGSTLEKVLALVEGTSHFSKTNYRAKFWWQRRQKSTPVVSLQTLYRTGPCRFFFVSKGSAWRFFSCRTPYVHPTAIATPEKENVKWSFFCMMKKRLKPLKEKCVYIYIIVKKSTTSICIILVPKKTWNVLRIKSTIQSCWCCTKLHRGRIGVVSNSQRFTADGFLRRQKNVETCFCFRPLGLDLLKHSRFESCWRSHVYFQVDDNLCNHLTDDNLIKSTFARV